MNFTSDQLQSTLGLLAVLSLAKDPDALAEAVAGLKALRDECDQKLAAVQTAHAELDARRELIEQVERTVAAQQPASDDGEVDRRRAEFEQWSADERRRLAESAAQIGAREAHLDRKDAELRAREAALAAERKALDAAQAAIVAMHDGYEQRISAVSRA